MKLAEIFGSLNYISNSENMDKLAAFHIQNPIARCDVANLLRQKFCLSNARKSTKDTILLLKTVIFPVVRQDCGTATSR